MSPRPDPVRAIAPCRADLAGGTLDIWPLGLLHPGAVTVNMALPVTVELEVDRDGERGRVIHTATDGEIRVMTPECAARDLTAAIAFALAPDGGLRIRVLRQAPFRSGLGGSSAYGVALSRAIDGCLGSARDDRGCVALVRDLEARVLGVPTGEQDHWAAVLGGVLALHLEPGGFRVEELDVNTDWLAERATVFFTGMRHSSGMVNWAVIRRRLDREPEAVSAFEAIASAARDCRARLLDADEAGVARAIRGDWSARRRLALEVSPPELDRLVQTALDGGATAVRACGAGGGGSLLIWHPAGARGIIAARLGAVAAGGRVVATGPARTGSSVTRGS